jgi:D-xylose 1-dehydrogenase (NADP+, D-xylono-1,5-lactone-forming)
MRKVKWGVLGCAAFAKSTAIPAMQKAEGVELAGIASRSLDKAEAFAEEFGFGKAYGSYEELLADPEIEAVYNPLPNGLHPEWTIKAAQAGKHSLVEKPFAANVEEAQEVANIVEQCGVKVMEAFMWRFHPMHRRARQLIRDGAIGELKFIRTAFTFVIARGPNVRLDPQLAGGGIMDVGCYCLSTARFLFDAEPTRVFARADYDPEYNVDMLSCGLLEFPGGYATFDAGFTLPFRCDYEAVGTQGRIYVPKAFLPGEEAEILVETGDKVERERFPGVNQWALEFEHLSRSIAEGTPLDYDVQDAVKQQRVIDAVYRSTRSGQPESV